MKTGTVWITRTIEGAASTAAAVEKIGFDTVIAPVLEVAPLHTALPGHDAVIFTSRNGVTAYTGDAIIAWCVGDATARTARAAGFSEVHSAGGDLEDLVHLIATQADRSARLFYAAPAEPAGDPVTPLRALGFTVAQAAVYETRVITPALIPAQSRILTHVLVHSTRGGGAAAAYIRNHHDNFAFTNLCFICISEAAWQGVANALAGDSRFTPEHRIASHPDESSLLRCLTADEE